MYNYSYFYPYTGQNIGHNYYTQHHYRHFPYVGLTQPVGSPYHYRNSPRDFGGKPFVIDINKAAKKNNTYRTAIWTGDHLQVTLMSINSGEDIGLEIHPHVDQFLRIEQGEGIVQMGKSKNNLNFEKRVYDDSAIFIPAGTWHNLTNTGSMPLKLYSIYAPPNHPFGTIHATKQDAIAAEGSH